MWLVARTLRYLVGRYLAEPTRSSQHTSRANAAEAHGILRERRREQDAVDAYLLAQRQAHRAADESARVRASR